jgi:hypothetical protein
MLANLAASATVTVTPIAADYPNKKVTFKVAWSGTATPYNNRVWVWVDFCPINGITPDNSFSTATISNPTITGGNGSTATLTARGFFIVYSSATNTGTTVTATLNDAPTGKFNWCAYGSDMPPNATVNAGGGYTLRGTKPFTINSSQTVTSNTFGVGTCIISITDPTGRPDGFATPALTIGSQNSPSRCNAGAVTLSAIASGGTTTPMTYTWTLGSSNYTTTTNSYTTNSFSSSTPYTVRVKNANNCESNPASGNITVNYPAGNGQAINACGCANNTSNCNGTCKTTSTYTQDDGPCTGNCHTAYKNIYDQCGSFVNQSSATYANSQCTAGCKAQWNTRCANAVLYPCSHFTNGTANCQTNCTERYYSYYHYTDSTCCCCN